MRASPRGITPRIRSTCFIPNTALEFATRPMVTPMAATMGNTPHGAGESAA